MEPGIAQQFHLCSALPTFATPERLIQHHHHLMLRQVVVDVGVDVLTDRVTDGFGIIAHVHNFMDNQELPAPILRSDVLSMDDLLPGLQLDGTVRNVVDFGAFVDIGVKQDGLLHRSQIPHGTVLSVGDVLTLEIMSVDKERGRISLGWVGE